MEWESLRGLWKRCITCVFVQTLVLSLNPIDTMIDANHPLIYSTFTDYSIDGFDAILNSIILCNKNRKCK